MAQQPEEPLWRVLRQPDGNRRVFILKNKCRGGQVEKEPAETEAEQGPGASGAGSG